MTKKQIQAFVYQLACFAVLFIAGRYAIATYTNLTGFWIPVTAFVIGTLVAPKFQAIRTKDGEKLYMKWIFIKRFKEIG